MSDFLLELRCEEIPARMQAGARADLERLFREHLKGAGVAHGALTVWSTPRRLALIVRDLPEATEAVREELKGPRTSAPPQALEGFLRKTGLSQDQLETRGDAYFAVIERPGRATSEVLAWAIAAVVRVFPWPKSMRWGAASVATDSQRWVRPLSGIVAIFGEALVPVTVGDVASGFMTLGHRFHHPGPITIGGASDYQEKLRACHVIVDHEERQDLIRIGATQAAADAGLTLVADEGLVVENAGLTEWPVPLLGRFDPAFLDVPPEVIQLTARTNQKYFVARRDGALADAFVCTANIEASDGGALIVDGNRKVLAARLSDARFFWEQDRKTPLADHAKKLERITFHEKLGTVADKVERVAKLAEWLCTEGIVPNCDPKLARQAAELCKADLVTEMVGEFPELQGLMGGYYARAEGLPDEVADAIRDHYKPVGQGDEVPTAPVTVPVSLADKLDTLAAFFAINMLPTGSRDPFALRRAALGVISVIQANNLRLPISMPLAAALAFLVGKLSGEADRAAFETGVEHLHDAGVAFSSEAQQKLRDIAMQSTLDRGPTLYDEVIEPAIARVVTFLADRLKVQQRDAGVRHDLIDAVFALPDENDLVRLLARVKALQAFIGTADGTNLHAGYKRAANILKKEDWHGFEGEIARTGEEDPLAQVDDQDLAPVIAAKMAERKTLSYTPETAEQALIAALDSAEDRAAAAVEAEDFEGAMAALASLRAPIDTFFDEVTVNDPDPTKRSARLELLARFRSAVHKVADFSRIEG